MERSLYQLGAVGASSGGTQWNENSCKASSPRCHEVQAKGEMQRGCELNQHLLHPWSRTQNKSEWLPTKPLFTPVRSWMGLSWREWNLKAHLLLEQSICSWSIASGCWYNGWDENGFDKECVFVWGVTSFTAGQISTPGQVPLTHEHFGAHQFEARVTLIGHHRAVHQVRVRCRLPAVRDLWKLWTRVIAGNLCKDKHKRTFLRT